MDETSDSQNDAIQSPSPEGHQSQSHNETFVFSLSQERIIQAPINDHGCSKRSQVCCFKCFILFYSQISFGSSLINETDLLMGKIIKCQRSVNKQILFIHRCLSVQDSVPSLFQPPLLDEKSLGITSSSQEKTTNDRTLPSRESTNDVHPSEETNNQALINHSNSLQSMTKSPYDITLTQDSLMKALIQDEDWDQACSKSMDKTPRKENGMKTLLKESDLLPEVILVYEYQCMHINVKVCKEL